MHRTPLAPDRRPHPAVRPSVLACLLVLSGSGAAGLHAQETATWYLGTYSYDVLVWDEASEEVVDRIAVENFIPTEIVVSEDKTRLYVRDASAKVIEVIDVEAGEVIDSHTLTADSVSVRIGGFAPHPSNDRAVMSLMRYTKHIDRFTVEGPFIVEYDLEAKEVTDTVPMPDGATPDAVGFRYSPDGNTLYLFANDIIALDAETYDEVDRWELSQPIEPGLGRGSFGTSSGTYDEPGVATSLFRMTDPAQSRRLMGISRVRLSEREVDFFTLGPSEPVGSFVLAPSGDKAYALYSEIGRYEFWEFDLEAQRVTRRQPFEGRPRMSLQVSADGEELYVYRAGNTIDVYDVDTFELMRTVEFDEDMLRIAVVPGAYPGR